MNREEIKMGRFAQEFVIVDRNNLAVARHVLGFEGEHESDYPDQHFLGSLIEQEIDMGDEVITVTGAHPHTDDLMCDHHVLFACGWPSRLYQYQLPEYLEPDGEGLIQATAEEWAYWDLIE